jgi:hypothetical protein
MGIHVLWALLRLRLRPSKSENKEKEKRNGSTTDKGRREEQLGKAQRQKKSEGSRLVLGAGEDLGMWVDTR